jgi:hypothetical protein
MPSVILTSPDAGFGSVRMKCCSMAIRDNVTNTHSTLIERNRAFSRDRLCDVITRLAKGRSGMAKVIAISG